ncbi:P1 family peptidase [Arthrobacter castelli]|uniref:DmpA family aminopeptidase n=1 Tax=Arthrobacter castelli TaxID=271431 RepID=UPI0009D64141|nr:P1 family peptidase [Arthrobacter castelli]
MKQRSRELGIVIGQYEPGRYNAITDVDGVKVGHTTRVSGEGSRVVGEGPVRTGVTVVMPRTDPWKEPLFSAPHRLNGNGELTGLEWIRESGMLTSHIGLTNTHSVGVVRDALVAHEASQRDAGESFFALPVVGETWDGVLNDINGFHVRQQDVLAAIDSAGGGPVTEGSVGGGTGMICHGFKGGIGTASRLIPAGESEYTIGVLVQANHGTRSRFTVNGVPIGHLIGPETIPTPRTPSPLRAGTGSIIIVVATDAPLIPTQCARLAQRAGLGMARTGGAGENGSGDIFLCFSTGNDELPAGFSTDDKRTTANISMLTNRHIDDLFYATIEATEEAILNAMLAAETMTGADGVTAHALPAGTVSKHLGGVGAETGRSNGRAKA